MNNPHDPKRTPVPDPGRRVLRIIVDVTIDEARLDAEYWQGKSREVRGIFDTRAIGCNDDRRQFASDALDREHGMRDSAIDWRIVDVTYRKGET